MPNESVETFQVNGTQIAHRRIGNGRPLLVLNGFAATSADWDSFVYRQIRIFGEVIDLRGGKPKRADVVHPN